MTWWLSIFDRFFRKVPCEIGQLAPPWKNRPSIFSTIRDCQQGLNDPAGCPLPDDVDQGVELIQADAGGHERTFVRHGVYGDDRLLAKKVVRAISRLFRRPTDERFKLLYDELSSSAALSYVDALLELIIDDKQFHSENLHDLAKRLAVDAPDREVVKVAIAILGLFANEDDASIFMTLGRHEEFTLYAAVAIANAVRDSDEALWELAQEVHGWGRIHLVERMAGTDNIRIRQWMLREGYKNNIMREYSAYTCATSGDLLSDLRRPSVEQDLLVGAGDLLVALINGRNGPAFGILDFQDGAECLENYLRHLEVAPRSLREFLNAKTIFEFLKSANTDWEVLRDQGWTSYLHFHLLKSTEGYLREPVWRSMIEDGLRSAVDEDFLMAAKAALYFCIDTWPEYFNRLEKGKDYWLEVLQTKDLERLSRVVALARAQLPLTDLSSGPSLKVAPELLVEEHRQLCTIVQELGRFAGTGTALVLAALKSPVVRNRCTSLKTLADWGRGSWNSEIISGLTQAIENEPDGDLRRAMKRVLVGKPLRGSNWKGKQPA
tara:strand:+ start:109 stop:1755 length:1647 start_codon:yes stop_codon:yes gene_type:complete